MPARKETRLRGRTWVNRWQPIDGTSNGVTVTTDETGLITVSGEVADGEQAVSVSNGPIQVSAGSSMVYMKSCSLGDVAAVLMFHDAEGEYMSGQNRDASTSGDVFTVPEGAATAEVSVYLASGSSLTTGTFRVMLVDGDEVPDCFTAPGVTSAEPTKLATAGRNLLGEGALEKLFNGDMYEVSDGRLIMTGGDGMTWPEKDYLFTLPPGDYAISADVEENSGSDIVFEFGKNGWYEASNSISGTGRKQLLQFSSKTTSGYAAKIYGSDGEVDSIVLGDIQLEPGSATDYEAPNVTETTLPEGLVLRSLPDGTADELVIRQDGTAYVERHTAYVESFADEYEGENYFSSGNGLNAGDSVVYEVEQTVEELGTVTLPELPETFCEYPVSDVPCRESVVYELG